MMLFPVVRFKQSEKQPKVRNASSRSVLTTGHMCVRVNEPTLVTTTYLSYTTDTHLLRPESAMSLAGGQSLLWSTFGLWINLSIHQESRPPLELRLLKSDFFTCKLTAVAYALDAFITQMSRFR